jgi:primary-amine oxidase
LRNLVANPLDPLVGDIGLGRPEDWLAMPVDVVSFWLKPFGFFDRNPSLDVVATPPDMCHTPSTSAHH